MKILSWNVNGIRSVHNKGFVDFLNKEDPDILCLQEIKAHKDQLPKELISPKGYYSYFNSAEKKGYSGVCVYTKQKPNSFTKTLGENRFDSEGRVLILTFPEFTLFNLYIPHGGRKKENLDYKLEVYAKLYEILDNMKDINIILIGDFNIAHREIDLARPKQNKKNIMFTPVERSQIRRLISSGFVDTFRVFNKSSGNYSWWPYYANARQRNLGWRIDYCFVSKNFRPKLKDAFILSHIKGSDHCPIGIQI